MVAIRYSRTPRPEVEVAATTIDFQSLAAAIMAMVEASAPEITVPANGNADPRPWDRCLSEFRLKQGVGPLELSLIERSLVASGSSESLLLLAHNLPIEAGLSSGYHVHFERTGREEFVSALTVPLVLRVSGSADA